MLALPARLDEQAVQAEDLRIGLRRQRLEGGARRRRVAGDLRGLRRQQQHQRLGPSSARDSCAARRAVFTSPAPTAIMPRVSAR
jgi:hypothetical protein